MSRLRLVLLIFGEATLVGVIVAAFWYQDWRYSLPTPKPTDLVQPPVGTPHAELLRRILPPSRGRSPRCLVLHFVSPECPCSRFNLEHVRGLVKQFPQVRFVAVLEGGPGPEGGDLLHLGMEAVADADHAHARALGVYSTPQAVVFTADGRLAFRGNYNRSRYCNDPDTAFVRRVLAALTTGRPVPDLPADATEAFGCPLPTPGADQP
jgi:hypothetical protein